MMGGRISSKLGSALWGAVAAARRKWQHQARIWRDFLAVATRLAPYVRKRVGMLAWALACGLGYTLMRVLEPWPIKLIFDNVLLDHPLPSFLRPVLIAIVENRFLFLNLLMATIIVMAIARGFLYFHQQLLTSRAGHQIVADLRLGLYGHLQSLSFSFHDRRRTGDLLTRLTGDIQVLREIFTSLPLTLTGELCLMMSMAVVMFLMDWRLTLLALTILPCLAVFLRTYRRPMKEAMRKQREREGRLATIASEVLGAIKVVQGFRREGYEVARFGTQNKKSLRSGLRAARLEAKLNWATELAVATVTALVLGMGVHRVLAGALSPGDLLVFVAYLHTFNRPLRRTSRMAQRMARATAAGERLLEILETQPTVQDRPGAVAAPRFRGEIAFEGASFAHYGQSLTLRDIDLLIKPGERVAIIGPTGAGKTTLVSLIPRFYDPTHGRVCIDNRDIRDFKLESLRQGISLVFQESVLFAATIAENIAYGKPNATREEVLRAAELAGIHPVIAALPDGYDTVIGERGGTLSGGQRQCVAIARAIIKDAQIVILDEPTAGLDGQSADLVIKALHRLMEGRTVISISHQLCSVQDVDRIVILEGGRLVEEGTHATLLARSALYQKLQLSQREGLTA
ncbi:MAG TPA: ABC transporter ATP-binding protein [Candidatus Tectomicrobia bacterium]|nr:ABC transporter ATP-binding protein [Candidatus Tectomicrobia bacterium]